MDSVMTAAGSFWFLNTLVKVRVSGTEGTDQISVLEHHVPHGDSPPLHVHHTEDEVFQILEGDFRMRIAEREFRATAGDILFAPKGVPHTYRAESGTGGRFLTITVRGDFEQFVRATARPAEQLELPVPAGPPNDEAIQTLVETAGKFGIEFVGPPLT